MEPEIRSRDGPSNLSRILTPQNHSATLNKKGWRLARTCLITRIRPTMQAVAAQSLRLSHQQVIGSWMNNVTLRRTIIRSMSALTDRTRKWSNPKIVKGLPQIPETHHSLSSLKRVSRRVASIGKWGRATQNWALVCWVASVDPLTMKSRILMIARMSVRRLTFSKSSRRKSFISNFLPTEKMRTIQAWSKLTSHMLCACRAEKSNQKSGSGIDSL